MLVYTSPGGVASYFYTEPMPILPSENAAASWFFDSNGSTGYYRARFEFLNAAGAVISSTGQTAYLNATGTVSYGPFAAPALTKWVRLRFDHYADTSGGVPAAGSKLQLRNVTVVKANSAGKVVATRKNEIVNPSFETNLTGFTANSAFGGFDLPVLSQSSTRAVSGTKSAKGACPASTKGCWAGWLALTLTPGQRYTYSFYVYVPTGGPDVRADVLFFSTTDFLNVKDQWIRLSVTFTAVNSNHFIGIATRPGAAGDYYVDGGLLELGTAVGTYFDGSTPAVPSLRWTYAWDGTAHGSSSTATITSSIGSTRQNLMPNPSFSVNTTGWSNNGTTVSLTRDTAEHYDAVGSLRVTNTNTRTDTVYVPSVVTTYRTNLSNNPTFNGGTVSGWQTDINNTFTLTAVPNPGGSGNMRVSIRPEWAGGSWGFEVRSTAAQRVPVVAGQIYAFALNWQVNAGMGATNQIRATGNWYNSAGAIIGTPIAAQDNNNPVGNWRRIASGAYAAPAGAVSFALELGIDNRSGGSRLLPSGTSAYVQQIIIEAGPVGGYFDGSFPASSSGDVAYSYSWTGAANASASTQRIDTTIYTPTYPVVPIPSSADAGAYADPVAIVGSQYYNVSFGARSQSGTIAALTLLLQWLDGAGTQVLQNRYPFNAVGTTWQRLSQSVTAPPGAARLRVGIVSTAPIDPSTSFYVDTVMLEAVQALGSYFDGDTAAGSGWSYAWTGTPGGSVSVAASTSLGYVPPLPYTDVLGPTHDITVTREELNVGTLTANIVDSTLDPSVSSLIRPGRTVRLQARSTATEWKPMFVGTLTHASVEYDLKQPKVAKRAHIELTAADNVQALSNQNVKNGVATIAELADLMEGLGVPWSVNGSGAQYSGTPVIVSINENTTALDQIAITRDTVMGYAWVDRTGVLQAWDRDKISTTPAGPLLDERVYSDINVSFNTDDLINEVNLKFMRFNPSVGTSEEVAYGPYQNQASIDIWGVHSATFTIQGVAEDAPVLAAYSNRILEANATPQIRLNSMDLHVRLTESNGDYVVDPASWFVWADLYDLVTTTCQRAAINQQKSRITSVKHTISAPDSKWNVELGFASTGVVASPTYTPPPTTTDGQTIGQLLRPIGEVTMYYGTKASIPAGWLPLDGSTFSAGTYPKLAGLLGSTTLPNMTDRLPIGAGTKALGTAGGSPTHTLTREEMFRHDHTGVTGGNTIPAPYYQYAAVPTAFYSATGYGLTTAGAYAQRVMIWANDSIAAHQHSITAEGSGQPFDVMNPWRAIWYIIRAL